MRFSLLLPLVFLALAGCVTVDHGPASPATTTTTVIPAQPTAYVAAPNTSTTTVIRTP
jgi:hypothetical protein